MSDYLSDHPSFTVDGFLTAGVLQVIDGHEETTHDEEDRWIGSVDDESNVLMKVMFFSEDDMEMWH